MAERQIELTWRCSSCGHRNLGRHLACQSCGSPKDDSEAYEMPPDPSAQASVTDPALLAMARAGANWRCRYCGSDARAPDGTCAQCGASQREAAVPAPHIARVHPRAGRSVPLTLPIVLGLLVGVLLVCGVGIFALRRPAPAAVTTLEPAHRDVVARVQSASWEHAISVERWQIVAREGFEDQKPEGAFEVKPAGERVHHVDKVPDGTTTETYTDQETRMVSESYSDREQCGEDCRPRPQTCREDCTNNQNGFATCKTVCSGGGQDCEPRYCTVQKTRMVQKSFPVQKTRTVPKFKDVPRMAKWLTWKAWDWAPARTVKESGTGFETRWPTEEAIALGKDLGKDEKERERRRASYEVALAASDGTHHRVFPATLDEFRRYENATVTLRVERHGGIRPISGPTPASSAAP
jgi:hypothetical protein